MPTVERISFKENGIWNEYDNLNIDHLRFDESKRGISFLSVEGQDKLIHDEIKGFCHKRFKANFIINGIDVNNLVVGQLLQIGDAIVKISKVWKDCLDECPIVNDSSISCEVNKQAFFGHILIEGSVSKNDNITLL